MKHSFLRRLGALALALALVLPMAVTAARADTGDSFRVEVEVPGTISLTGLKSAAALTAVPYDEAAGGTVTYSWTSEGGVVSIAPTSGANVTITPVEVGQGTVTVTATCTWQENGQSKSVTAQRAVDVNVISVPVSSLQITGQTATMKTGETQQLSTAFSPANATNQGVTWTTSDPAVVSVDQTGFITALKEGTATITARSVDDQTKVARFPLTVTDAATPTLTLSPDSVGALVVGDVFQLTAAVTPDSARVEWKSSNPRAVALENEGRTGATLRALAQGSSTITVTATGTNNKKVTATRTVTVGSASSLFATSMTAKSPTALTLSAEEQSQLAVNVTPATANVTWSSDNSAAATVNPATGMVTAVASGKANITATAQKADGTALSVKFQITVMGRATGIQFASTNYIQTDAQTGGMYTQFNSNDGRSRTVSVNVSSQGGTTTNTYIDWSSSDTSIVTCAPRSANTSADLSISTSRQAGEATVTATVYDSTTKKPVLTSDGRTPLAAKLKVVVSGVCISETSLTMYEGEGKTISLSGYGEAENETATTVAWRSTDSSIVSMEGGTLNAWSKGEATITATTRNNKYSATCKVTVTNDPNVIVNAGSATAGNPIVLGTSTVVARLNQVARRYTNSNMDSISGIYVTPAQGVVYNNHRSEADTGSGVAMSEIYTVNGTGPQSVQALSFVPNRSFTGEARISYTGTSRGQTISGTITVNVSEMSDVTYTAEGVPVPFLTDDFNLICQGRTGSSLKYVTFTPPDGARGTLYYNYIDESHPGEKVVASTQYNRTSNPLLGQVTFVPAQGYSGTVKIAYRAMDISNRSYSGTVTVNVKKPASGADSADIYYTAPQDGWVTFRAADFASASLRTIGETLSHVRFTLPNSSDGTLFYNYRGFGNYDGEVISTTSYYQSGTPSLGGVTFVPATTAEGQNAITYTGYSTRGTAFTGTVYVGEGSGTNNQPGTGTYYEYSVNSGSQVNLSVTNFNNACVSATGATLNYIRFTSLPAGTQGTLRYRTGSSNYYNNVSTSHQFYRASSSSSALLIGNLSFLANASYTGVVRIPYVGYNTNGASFTGEVTIQVTPNTIVYNGTTANPIRLSASRVSGAVGATFSRPLSYIEFTSLPSASAGRMYLGYSRYGTGTQVSTGVRYYATSTAPAIDQLSFVPKGRFTGDATASYTAYSTSGERMTGQITFRISGASGSSYFTDMGGHTWAAPSVDYLYQNSVTQGMTATTYGPNLPIRRGDFILMLYRAFRFSGGNANNPGFADVPAGAYYAQAVSAAKQMGIVNGDGVNFMPNNSITRQDAMVMVKNAMTAAGKFQGSTSTAILNNFPDGTAVSSYAREAVSALIQMGAVNGSNGMLNPRSAITRAEAAVILHFVMTA